MVADAFLNVEDPQMAHFRVFGAQTLHLKLQKDWKQLPVESRLALRNSLMNHLKVLLIKFLRSCQNRFLIISRLFIFMVFRKH